MKMAAEFEGQRDGERIILLFRRSLATIWKSWLFLLVVAGGGLAPCLLHPANTELQIMAVIAVAVGLAGPAYLLLLRHFSFYLLTTERLRQVRQKSLFNRVVVDLELDKVMSVSYGVAGLCGNLFNYGTVLIQTGAGDLVLSKVKNPERIHSLLQDAIHETEQAER